MDHRASTIPWLVNRLLSCIFLIIIWSSCSCHLFCSARDVIEYDTPIRENGETLVSTGGRFELGFFTPNGSSDGNRYVGIWYTFSRNTVVWVANRNDPLFNSSGVFGIQKDGNLHVWDNRTENSSWSTALDVSRSPNRKVKLMDSGNLVLQEGSQQGEILWESFKSPTDTFLPNMTMDANLILTSWRDRDEPGTGDFTFKLDADAGETQFITTNKSKVHWKSAGEFATSNKMRDAIVTIISVANKTQTPNRKPDSGLSPPDIFDTMLVLKFDGNITYQKWDKYKKAWILIWLEPRDRCSIFNFCGNFGLCSSNNALACQCLPGFRPTYQDKWDSGEFSDGCIRETELCSKPDRFLGMKMRNIGNPDGPAYPANNETECRNECHGLCQCQAYSFQAAKYSTKRGDSDSSTSSRWIWSRELYDLQEDYADDSHNLSVRIALSDVKNAESTVRNCNPCGRTSVPYPLSTGRDCGDPMYFSFQCSSSMGNLTFKAPSGEYQVISIDPHNRKFVIQVKDFDVCDARNIRGNLPLNKSLPFNVANWCYTKNFPQRRGEIELVWEIPPEPTCTLQESCNDWPYSTCSIANDGKRRCRCNTNYTWDGVNLNCTAKQGVIRGGL